MLVIPKPPTGKEAVYANVVLPKPERDKRWAFYAHITHGHRKVDQASDVCGIDVETGYNWLAWCREQYRRMLPNRRAQMADARDGCKLAIAEMRAYVEQARARHNENAAIGWSNLIAHYEEMAFKIDGVLAAEQGLNDGDTINHLEINFGHLPEDVQRRMAEALMGVLV